MTKTFRANPSSDKYKLRSRVSTIETTPSTKGDISLKSGGGLEKHSDGSYKLKISDTGGFQVGSAGLELKKQSVTPLHMTNSHALDTGGLEMVTTADQSRMKIKLDGTSLETSSSGLKLKTIPDNTITPIQLNLSSSIFQLFCVERTSWTDFGAPGSTAGVKFVGDWVSFDTVHHYRPQFLVEKFNYYGGSPLVWYRIYLRGAIKKAPGAAKWGDTEIFGFVSTAYKPSRILNFNVPFFDSDNTPSWRQTMVISIEGKGDSSLSGYMRTLQINPVGAHTITNHSHFFLNDISFDTLQNPST
jgi:hypothetical protein